MIKAIHYDHGRALTEVELVLLLLETPRVVHLLVRHFDLRSNTGA